MSAVPESFMYEPPIERTQDPEASEEKSFSSFWQWFALAVLLFCWIAEATMCADRGF